MSDLVERLRGYAHFINNAVAVGREVSAGNADIQLFREAADRIEEAEAEVEALDQKCRALSVAHGPLTCGCSYDRPDDICAAHSPQVMAARARLEALEKATAPFVRAWGDEMFLWSRDDLARFRAEGIPTSNPRYSDDTSIYCVIEPGKDHEDRSDDALFTVGDLRALARAAGGGE